MKLGHWVNVYIINCIHSAFADKIQLSYLRKRVIMKLWEKLSHLIKV